VLLGKEWRPLGTQETKLLEDLHRTGRRTASITLRGQEYNFDLAAGYQTNLSTGRPRRIRRVTPHQTALQQIEDAENPVCEYVEEASNQRCVEVWLAGDWKRLPNSESMEIARRQAAGESHFEVVRDKFRYQIDLKNMTQTNVASNRTRIIRFMSSQVGNGPDMGFGEFREAFHRVAQKEKYVHEEQVTRSCMAWADPDDISLLTPTVKAMLKEMDLRGTQKVDMTQWNHYWALERDSPSFHAGRDVNEKLREALVKDPQVLGRMQMHFDTAVGEGSSKAGLSKDDLQRACKRLVGTPQEVIEKQWAAEVLEQDEASEFADDYELTYYDFLNVMLGRKRFKVTLYMYDISDGRAQAWSWLLLGKQFKGIWHTGVVVEWPDRSAEFWYGGRLFESKPGTTPFGEPVEKRTLGYTYKLREEVWAHVSKFLAVEFTHERYDVLTHNCNHFSDRLSMFLRNEHIPDEIRLQPDMVMNSLVARALRPLLNHWLGNFGGVEGRATDDGSAARKLWEGVMPGALIEFSKEELGRPLVGRVTYVSDAECAVACVDFWARKTIERCVPRQLVTDVLAPAPASSTSRRTSEVQGPIVSDGWLCKGM